MALGHELVNLGVRTRYLHRCGMEIALVATSLALLLGPTAATTIAPELLAGALGAGMLRKNHALKLRRHPILTHYPLPKLHQQLPEGVQSKQLQLLRFWYSSWKPSRYELAGHHRICYVRYVQWA
jgi:hypothetical protein